MYEELMNEDEAELIAETEDMFILSPFEFKQENKVSQAKIYKSKDSNFMTVEEIRRMLKEILNAEHIGMERIIE